MSSPPVLLFGIHCHQPVGNFESVMERALQRSYQPFLEVATRHRVPFAVHYSGTLLEWLESRGKRVLDLVGELVERGQVEVLVSGMYEPVLPAIPWWDRLGQLEMAKEWVWRLWGIEPKGVWLTERVWEPQIVKEVVAAGMEYVVVDDYHLLCAGVEREEVKGYFLTEHEGDTLAVFPISKALRYLVPFGKMKKVKSALGGLPGGVSHTLFDDGEKFGLWPGTYRWVYRQGWLEEFFGFLEGGEVEPLLFGQYLSSSSPRGRVYLPTASYPEMGEWALPPRASRRLSKLREGLEEGDETFLRGGTWKNFLVRYPEANWLHKRVLWISKGLRDAGSFAEKTEALRHLYRAQCNDAYWHGVFGGLYAPHLRGALWRELLNAQRLLGSRLPRACNFDLDCDGSEEVVLQNEGLFAAFKPGEGGCMVELSSLDWGETFTNVLTRRPEAYHWGMSPEKAGEEDLPSIHQLPSELPRRIAYDSYQKRSFIDHLLAGLSKTGVEGGDLREPCALWKGAYLWKLEGERLTMSARGGFEGGEVLVSKSFQLSKGRLEVEYHLCLGGEVARLTFAFELNLLLPSERFAEIRVRGSRGERHLPVLKGGVVRECDRVVLRDPLWKGDVELELEERMGLVVVSNASVSKSERGFDRVYQGNTLLFSIPLERGERRFSLRVSFTGEKGGNSV